MEDLQIASVDIPQSRLIGVLLKNMGLCIANVNDKHIYTNNR